MIKKLLITYLFLITNVFAGLPPTTMRGQSQTLKPTTFNFQVPNKQATITAASTSLIETGNNNELENRGFEHTTVTTGWTVSNATSSSSTTRIEGSKSLSLALTGALSLSQSSTINAAQKSGVQMVASIWVNSSDVSDLQLCSLKNGSEDKCTVTGGYVQGSGWRQLTVSFLGDSTSNGLKLKSTDTTGTVLVDQAYVGIGSPVVDFTPDMVYSARVSSTGVVSNENVDWINGNASISDTSLYTITFNPSIFSVTPNCVAMVGDNSVFLYAPQGQSITASQFIVRISSDAATKSAQSFNIICQKQGADYKTSNAYVASSSDYGWTSFTPTSPNSSVAMSSPNCYHKREGQDLLIDCKFNPSSLAASEMRISIPGSLSIDSTIISSDKQCGVWYRNEPASNAHKKGVVICGSGLSYMRFAIGDFNPAGSPFATRNGNEIVGAGQVVQVIARIPIQGWTDSSVIVGSFQGYNETPGTSRVETFSVSYGTTNATTVCSASPCSYLDQIGNAVTSITRSGAGQYSLNLSKTYTKLKCTYGGFASGLSPTAMNGQALACSSSSACTFTTPRTDTSTAADSYGTLYCQGIPQ